jgi:hypothetical protein
MKDSVRIKVEVRVSGKKSKQKWLLKALKGLCLLVISALPVILRHIT